MIELDDAIAARLMADPALVAMLGSADAISAEWPEAAAVYADVPVGVTDYATLPPCDPPRARVTFGSIAPTEDLDIPKHDDLYQHDVFSRSHRLNGAIAARIKAVLDDQPLDPASLRVTETYCTYGPPFYEADTRLYHDTLTQRIVWVPAT